MTVRISGFRPEFRQKNRIWSFFHVVLVLGFPAGCTLMTAQTNRIFVKVDGSDLNDGKSWTNAFKTIQQALFVADTITNIDDIWVARGTYYPDKGPT